MRILTGIIHYNRPNNLERWLHAWYNEETNKFGSPLVIVHNQDTPRFDRSFHSMLAEWNPDYLIQRPNIGCDIGAFAHLGTRTDVPEWDILLWFTDDMMPMSKRFLEPFIDKLQDEDVGLVGFCYEPEVFPDGTKGCPSPHFRTTAFGIRREVFMKLKFPYLPTGRPACFHFEHGDHNMTRQVLKMGKKVDVALGGPINSPEYIHWTAFADVMWDCHLQADRDLWEDYNREFGTLLFK